MATGVGAAGGEGGRAGDEGGSAGGCGAGVGVAAECSDDDGGEGTSCGVVVDPSEQGMQVTAFATRS
jgi:hypothetical protein